MRLGLGSKETLKLNRETIARIYLVGDGIEIGALHMPLKAPDSAHVKYVDRMTVEDLRKQYPELDDKPLVNVDIIADGERLESISDSTQDFVIANHFIEHCQDPIGALINMVRVLKPGGALYLAIPDKRCSFDIDRPVTPLEHILRDHKEGPQWSKRQHFEEWTRLVDKVENEQEAELRTAQNLERDYSIHFHVWTQAEMLEMIVAFRKIVRFELELCLRHEAEVIFILRRSEAKLFVEDMQSEKDVREVKMFADELDRVLSPEPWCIDNIQYDGEVFEMVGWALVAGGLHDRVTFMLNDKEFEEVSFPLPRQDVTEVFWYKPGSDKPAFHCRTRATRDEVFKNGYATLKCVDRETELPIREEYNWYYPDDSSAPDLPDPDRRRRVAGNENASVFRLEGFTTFTKLDLALRRIVNQGLDEFHTVLDWGCGCGRVTRYFHLLPQVRLIGVDIDADNLQWSREHFTFGEFYPSPLRPPTSLEPSSFDLIIGISVFSHLKERDQIEWLYELGRVAKPGAVLLMSVLGEATAGRSCWSKSLWDEWHKTGFLAISNNVDLKGYIEDDNYYVSTYMTMDHIRKSWSRFFTVLEIIPAYIGNQQDLVVMRKPA